MASGPFFIGVDFGTDSVRAVLLDGAGGEAAVRGILRGALRGASAGVKSLGVCATGSTAAPLDGHGSPLSLNGDFEGDPDAMFALWKNHTALEEAESITRAAKLCDWIPSLLAGMRDPARMRRGRCPAGHKALWHENWGATRRKSSSSAPTRCFEKSAARSVKRPIRQTRPPAV